MAECDVTGCNGMARPVVCEGHTSQVRSNVAQFPMLYVRLRQGLRPSQSVGEHVSGTRAPQASMSMAVYSVMEDMVTTTSKWARLAREHRGVAPMSGGRASVRLTEACDSLRRHDETILALSIAGEYVSAVRKIQQRADIALKQDRLVHRLVPPCPACETKALVRRDGDEWVLCVACGARWDEREYDRLVKVLAYQLQLMEARA